MKPNGSGRIYMDSSTIEYGKECSDCLRWFVPLFTNDPCPHCLKRGRPQYPNRLRYLSVKNNVSLREISRRTRLEWRTVSLVAQGKRAPHIATKRKLLRALGIPVRKNELLYAFPHPRQR